MASAKRKLKNITFKTTQKHIAITDESEPACSGYGSEAVLFKSESVDKSLTENQKRILDELNVEYDKENVLTNKSTEDAPVASEVDNNQNQPETESEMSDEIIKSLQDKVAAMELELHKSEAKQKLAKFELDAELNTSVVDVLAGIQDEASVEVIIKSFEALSEVAVSKSNKAAEGNAIAKSLSEETGIDAESEKEDEKEDTVLSKAMAYADQIEKGDLK